MRLKVLSLIVLFSLPLVLAQGIVELKTRAAEQNRPLEADRLRSRQDAKRFDQSPPQVAEPHPGTPPAPMAVE